MLVFTLGKPFILLNKVRVGKYCNIQMLETLLSYISELHI